MWSESRSSVSLGIFWNASMWSEVNLSPKILGKLTSSRMKGGSCWITRQSWWRPWSQGSSVLLLATLLRLTHPTGTTCSPVVHPSHRDFFLSHVYDPPSAGISETPTLKTAPRTSTHASVSSDQTLWRGHLDQAQFWTLNLLSEIPPTGWHLKTQSGCPTHKWTDKQMKKKQHLYN